MTTRRPKSKPRKLQLSGVGKKGVRTQFAALCFRTTVKGKLKVCLITSRNSGRWILPKGWPIDGRTPARAAAQEAWEEAGLKGRSYDQCLGVYDYRKSTDRNQRPLLAMVYPLKVKEIAKSWPEARQRQRKWVTLPRAAELVSEPGLKLILEAFDPNGLA